MGLLKSIFGDKNTRKIRSFKKLVDQVNALEVQISALSDDELKNMTNKFKERLKGGESLESLQAEAFATVRETSKRVLGLRPFDVQIIGGAVLHNGDIAEMRTGEGKTLTATMPIYLNALTGRQIHVVTVNDYLARRDAETMGKIFEALGMTTAALVPQMPEADKQAAYASDVLYATNNELGFDYLRDNMKPDYKMVHQKDHYFAIIDEVDSILIDEARTPLIISGPTPDRSELYIKVNVIVPALEEETHFDLDEKSRSATLTDDGIDFVEVKLKEVGLLEADATLYDPENTQLVHHVNQSLLAHKVYKKDRHYLMRGQDVMLVDEFTGRVMEGRRLSNGLHQAIEAKEGVQINPENVTLASVTYQNYFRMYEKLAGMTGTAMTEAAEFQEIYNLDTLEVPTNLPVARIDNDDRIYRTESEKVAALVSEVKAAHEKGQPVLIGTTSIDKSEMLSKSLTGAGLSHKILNARHHEQEAEIIAKAGEPGAITIATNMAGRGTDIQLGGNMDAEIADTIEKAGADGDPVKIREEALARVAKEKEKALEAGGLFVIGTERHESRRIDNQLRGRSGRQGDPGRTLFFLSLEDDLLRIFGGDRMNAMVSRMGLEEGEAMEHKWLNKALERAQRKVEGRNFDIRKNLLKFDDIMNEQRKIIFSQRKEILISDDVREMAADMRDELVEDIVEDAIPEGSYAEQWDAKKLDEDVKRKLNIAVPIADWFNEDEIDEEEVIERIQKASDVHWTGKREKYGEDSWKMVEKQVILQAIDRNWRDHLEALDHLRSVINFRGYAQRDPFIEYKTESFEMFEVLLKKVREESATQLSLAELMTPAQQAELKAKQEQAKVILESGRDSEDSSKPSTSEVDEALWSKVGRNDLCPCGSGKKFKHCHGKLR